MILSPEPTEFRSYHGEPKRASLVDPEDRPFITWDGEGINLSGPNRPQSYILFGSSQGHISARNGLRTFQLLDHILDTGRQNPSAFHVGFAFNYDSNMILKGMHEKTLEAIHRNGHASLRKRDGTGYRVTFTPGKIFRVTRYGPNYHREHNATDKLTVTIEDIFTFFGTSFVKAYTNLVGSVPEIVSRGKDERPTFTIQQFDDGTIYRYWSVEIQMLRELADELRKRMYGAGLKITRWYGPGVLASYSMKQNRIKEHMNTNNERIREASRYGYAGGRFELFKIGRFDNVWSLDINSAYPAAIAELPSLTEGHWRYTNFQGARPKALARFGIYHVRALLAGGLRKDPGPLFHRDFRHNISYPWFVEGWYWTPEAKLAAMIPGVEIVEGWEYLGATSTPFSYIGDMYSVRQNWKRQGNTSQLALKLCMNSHYGKMAQRVGWDKEKNRLPPWHQLEWAGWVTSWTRAKLYEVMKKIPWYALVAVETDGIYTTIDPLSLGIVGTAELGGWEVSLYDEMYYVQSGLAWMRQGECKAGCGHNAKRANPDINCAWSPKRRGLDADSFSLSACQKYISSLHPNEHWAAYEGKTTRFIGLGAALNSRVDTRFRHCVWKTSPREISPGAHGKRIHISRECSACQLGKSADEMAHDLVIRSLSGLQGAHSFPHHIPWEPLQGDPEWRKVEDELGELIGEE